MQAPVAFPDEAHAFLVVYTVEFPHFQYLVAAALEEGRRVAFHAFASIDTGDYTRIVRYDSRRLLRELGKFYDCSVSKVSRNYT